MTQLNTRFLSASGMKHPKITADRHSEGSGRTPGPFLKSNTLHSRSYDQSDDLVSIQAPKGRFLLKAIDHTHCFTCGRPLSRSLRNIDKIKHPRIFGLFPEFRKYLDRDQVRLAAKDLGRIKRADASRMTQDIPKEWDVTQEALEALRDFIVGRAGFVSETIEERLWPQRELDFNK